MNTANTSLVGAILAGGRGTRMGGRDKAALEVGGRSLAHHAVDLLAPRCDEVIALAGALDQFPVEDVPHFPDRAADRGPLGGLDAAFFARPGQDILLVAVDLGLLPTSVIDELLACGARYPDAPAVIPATDRRLQPACAIYRAALAQEVARRVDTGDPLALGALADVAGTVIVPGDWSDALFTGVNTPHDLESARKRFPVPGA